MKPLAHPKLVIIFSFVLLSTSLANAQASLPETFLQCLDKQPTDPASPISRAAYIPSNSTFPTALRNYVRNLRFFRPTTPKPVAIVAAATWTHIQATLGCCRELGLQVRIRSGGHDYEGLSYVSDVPFIILDMFKFRSIDINMTDATVWVQAGATVGELYYSIAQKSNVLGFPAGVCPTLGTGGHFSGGGYGNIMRKYGLSVDNIIDAQIVDSNGNIYTDRKSMGEDVFWAIRGGGAASFGVVLAWKIKLVPVPERVTVFNVERTIEDGLADLVWKWQNTAYKLNKELFIRLFLNTTNEEKGGEKIIKISFIGMYLGLSDELLALMNQSFPELKLQKTDCLEMRWIESTLFWYSYPKRPPLTALLDRSSDRVNSLKRKSDYVNRPIPKSGLESMFKKMIETQNLWMQWNPYGGRMSEIQETATPFPHRKGILFKIQYSVDWSQQGDDALANNSINGIRAFYDFMRPYVSKNPREAFLNYRDIDVGSSLNSKYEEGLVYGVKYYKTNFERLVEVKTKFDRDNFFWFEQSIPVRK